MDLILSNTYVVLGGVWEMLISVSSTADRYLARYEWCRQWKRPTISQQQQLITKHTHTRQFHDGMSDYSNRTIQHYIQVAYFYQNVFRYVAIHFYISLYLFPTLKLPQANTLFQHQLAMKCFILYKSVVLFLQLKCVIGLYAVRQVKVKCTLVQALRLCTGCTAHKGSRGIALLFHDQQH